MKWETSQLSCKIHSKNGAEEGRKWVKMQMSRSIPGSGHEKNEGNAVGIFSQMHPSPPRRAMSAGLAGRREALDPTVHERRGCVHGLKVFLVKKRLALYSYCSLSPWIQHTKACIPIHTHTLRKECAGLHDRLGIWRPPGPWFANKLNKPSEATAAPFQHSFSSV